MRAFLPTFCLVTCLAMLTGCATTPAPKPPAATLAPEYVVALEKVLRIPEKNPLLDEGRVPLSALNIVAAYQNICLRGRYRDLAAFYDEATRQAEGAKMETDLLRQETVQRASLAVLTDIIQESNAGPYPGPDKFFTFRFTHPHRNGTSSSQLTVKVSPAGSATLVSRF